MHKVVALLLIVAAGLVLADDHHANWQLLNIHGTPPSPRDAIAAVAFGDTIFTFSGFRENLDPTNSLPNVFYNDIFTFYTPSKTWTHLSPHPDPVFGVPDPRAFSIGGRNGDDMIVGFGITYTSALTDVVAYNDLWAYNTHTNTWRMILPNNNLVGPSPRAETITKIVNGKIYLFGGATAFFSTKDDTWIFDLATGVWTQLVTTVQPSPRYGAAVAQDDDGRIWVYGGERSVFTATGVTFVFAGPDAQYFFDTNTNEWVFVNPLATLPNRNNGNGAVWIAGLFIIYGGDIGGGPVCANIIFQQNNVRETWSYNSHTNTWNQLCPSTIPPNFKRATEVLVGSTIYMFGGFAYDSFTCGPFDLNTNTWAYSVRGCEGGIPCASLSH